MSINLVFAVSFFNMMGVRAGRVMVALYALSLGAQPLAVGMLAATFSVFPGVLSWPFGILTDRVGSRAPLMIGTVALAFAGLAPYFFPGMPALFAASALIGLSFSFFNVSTQNLIGLMGTREDHTRNFSNFSLVQSVASFAGPLLIGFGIDHAGFGISCLALAVLPLVPIAMLMLRGGGLPGGASGARATGSLLQSLRAPGMWRILATGSLVVTGIELYQFYLPVYAHARGLSASAIGFVLAMFSAASFVVRLAMSALLKRLKEETVLAYSFFIAAAGLLLLPFFENIAVLALISFLLGLGLGCGQPITMAMAFTGSEHGRSGELMGLRVTINNLTRVVVPVIFGTIGSLFGLFAVFWVNAAMLGAGGALTRPPGGKDNRDGGKK
jgi:MFS family permease